MNYFVLYKRDVKTEKQSNYRQRMLFDKYQEFNNIEKAQKFATMNLPSILGQRYPLTEENTNIRDAQKPYVVAAEYYGKYGHTDFTGDRDPLRTYDAIRCSKDKVEQTIETLAKEEHVENIVVGIELKLI